MSLATTRLAAPVSMHGRPLGVDLTTTRSQEAQRFFERLLGWTFSARLPLALVPERDDELMAFLDRTGTPTYTLARCHGELVAEFIAGEPPDSLWVPQIAVDDLGMVLSLVDGAGGTIIEAPHSRGDAWVAVIADSGGARLSIWQARPDSHALADAQLGTLRRGSLQWIELETSDVARTVAFYQAIFSWEAHEERDNDGSTYTVFSDGGQAVAGTIAGMRSGVADSWCPSFSVVDTDVAVNNAVRLGAVVLAEATDLLVGRQAFLVDPAGGICGIVGPRPSGFCPL